MLVITGIGKDEEMEEFNIGDEVYILRDVNIGPDGIIPMGIKGVINSFVNEKTKIYAYIKFVYVPSPICISVHEISHNKPYNGMFEKKDDLCTDCLAKYICPYMLTNPATRKYIDMEHCETEFDRASHEFAEGKITANEFREKMLMPPVESFSEYMNTPETENQTPSDQVNHPSHYNDNGYECIEVMEAIYGPEKVKIFCELNAFKYLWRAGKKDGESEKKDIKKANWYTDRAKTILENEEESGLISTLYSDGSPILEVKKG